MEFIYIFMNQFNIFNFEIKPNYKMLRLNYLSKYASAVIGPIHYQKF